jgi:serine/threonine-protein kinase
MLDARKSPAEDLPRYLLIFEQMCQALAYAHARGVIHRDLKPSNVMVGAFGEVQVMDWGLAKVLSSERREHRRPDQGSADPLAYIQTLRTDVDSAESRAGSVLGTPAYMPPEQARGEIHLLDERADVFGLGAILCEILTGDPPFTGSDVSDLVDRSAKGELTDAFDRLARCGSDDELTGIAHDCLNAERDSRPRDAGEVAARVAAYRAGVQERLHKAEVDRAAADARAEEAQARALAEEHAKEQAQAKAKAERRAKRLTLGLAASVLLTVVLGGGTAVYLHQQQLFHQNEKARHVAEVEQSVNESLRQATEALRRANWLDAEAAVVRAEATIKAGPAVGGLAEKADKVRGDFDMASRLEDIRMAQAAEAADGGFDHTRADVEYRDAFTGYGLDPLAADIAGSAERIRHKDIRTQLVEALDDWAMVKGRLKADGREQLLELAGQADVDDWRKQFRHALARNDVDTMKHLAVDANMTGATPATLALVGYSLNRAGEQTLAIKVLRDAQRRHPSDFWINQRLGLYLSESGAGDSDEAIGYFRAAVAQRPQSPAAQNLGARLYLDGKLPEAEAIFREAALRHPRDAVALRKLAMVLNAEKRYPEADKAARAAIDVNPNLAVAHHELGLALQAQGKIPEAIAAFQAARPLDPTVAASCLSLGALFSQQNKLDEAEAEYREAVRREPKHASCWRDLGILLKKRRNFEEAKKAFDTAIQLRPKDARAHFLVGTLYLDQRLFPDAESALQHAIRLKSDYGDAYLNLGSALASQGKARVAETAFRDALRYLPDSTYATYYLGRVLYFQQRFDEAVAPLRHAYELEKKRPEWKMAADLADEAERLAKLEATLARTLGPEERSAVAAELSEAIALCQKRKMFAAAARFYADAFHAYPELPEEREKGYRYDAARVAVLAAAGLGAPEARVGDTKRSRLRREALQWLRADLAAWKLFRTGGTPDAAAVVAKKLAQWKQDADLASVRDKEALGKLDAVERTMWEKLWREVEGLLRLARGDSK